MDLEALVKNLPDHERLTLLPALKILVEYRLFAQLATQNANRLVAERMDSSVDDDVLAKEVRETRQTTRVLLGIEESARKLTEGL